MTRGYDYSGHGDHGPRPTSIEIPFRGDGGEAEVIEIVFEELSDDTIDEVINVLTNEKSQLHYWISIAYECYRRGLQDSFEKVLETARHEANLSYNKVEDDQVRRFCFFKLPQ